jgi:hypothetical protein
MISIPANSGAAKFWLTGVLIDKEICLFDPRMGIPLPAPSCNGVATLAQIRTTADPFARLNIDESHRYDVTPEQVRTVEVRIAFPLSSLSPRMMHFESLLDNSKARFAVDLGAVRRRFEAVAKPLNVPVRVDCRPSSIDTTSPLRIMRQFLPAGEGGTDTAKRKQREDSALIPWSILPAEVVNSPFANALLFRNLQRVFGDLYVQFPLRAASAAADTAISRPDEMMRHQGRGMAPDENREDIIQRFAALPSLIEDAPLSPSAVHFTLAPRGPRDDMIRGRLDDAANKLMEGLDQAHAQKSLRQRDSEINAKMGRWLEQAVEAEAQLQRVRRTGASGGMDAVQARLNALWFGEAAAAPAGDSPANPRRKRDAPLPVWLVWVLGSTADSLGADAAYFLALCKHDQAERLAAAGKRSPPERVADAWRTADRLWSQFLEDYPNSAAAPAARACRGRALEANGERAAAAALWENVAGDLSPLEKLGRLHQAKRLKEP